MNIVQVRSSCKWQRIFLFLLISIFFSPVHAKYNRCCVRMWHPFLTVGGGLALSPSLGGSRIFITPDNGPNVYSNSSAGIRGSGAFDGFAGIEWRFYPYWSLQLGLGYNQTTSLPSNGSWVRPQSTATAKSFEYSYNVIVRQYLGEIKILANIGPYHPYLEGGAGISQNDAYNYLSDLSTKFFVNGSTSSFTYNAGFGVDISVFTHVRIGLGYRFGNFGKVKLGNQVSFLNQPVKGTLTQSPFYVHEGLIEFTFLL